MPARPTCAEGCLPASRGRIGGLGCLPQCEVAGITLAGLLIGVGILPIGVDAGSQPVVGGGLFVGGLGAGLLVGQGTIFGPGGHVEVDVA